MYCKRRKVGVHIFVKVGFAKYMQTFYKAKITLNIAHTIHTGDTKDAILYPYKITYSLYKFVKMYTH